VYPYGDVDLGSVGALGAGLVRDLKGVLDWLHERCLASGRYAPDHQPAFEAWTRESFAHYDSLGVNRVRYATTSVWWLCAAQPSGVAR
jgi:hypothetical protein